MLRNLFNLQGPSNSVFSLQFIWVTWAIWPVEGFFILENKSGHIFFLLRIKSKLHMCRAWYGLMCACFFICILIPSFSLWLLSGHTVCLSGLEENDCLYKRKFLFFLQVIRIHGKNNCRPVNFCMWNLRLTQCINNLLICTHKFSNKCYLSLRFWILSISIMNNWA